MKRARLGHVWRGELYLQYTRHWLQASSKALSLYTLFIKGATWVCFLLSLCLSTTGKPSELQLSPSKKPFLKLISLSAMTKMTFYQLYYYFRAVEPTSDDSLINMGQQFCCFRIDHCTTLKWTSVYHWMFSLLEYSSVDEESKQLSLTSPVCSISSAHLYLSSLPVHCPLLSFLAI